LPYNYVFIVDLLRPSLLEKELQRLQKVSELREKELQQELTSLKAENERQRSLLSQVIGFHSLRGGST
jgi:hypothetical protein